MNTLSTTATNLPSTIPELSKFVLVGRDKLQAVRAEIHAIEKVGLAREVREQKLQEAQEIAEVVTDAEVRIGELIKQIPKATPNNNPFHQISPRVDLVKPKSEVLKESGITQRQAEHFQIMASNPESVERAKEKARQNGEVLSRTAVLNQVYQDKPKPKTARQEVQEAKERHKEFQEARADNQPLSFMDARKDASDVAIIGRNYRTEILNAIKAVNRLTFFKTDTDVDSLVRIFDLKERTELSNDIGEAIRRLEFVRRAITESR